MKTKTAHVDSTNSCLERFPLIYAFVRIWQEMRPAFVQERVHKTGLEIALGLLSAFGRRTITRGICARALQYLDWSRFYRFFSKDHWSATTLTHQLLCHLERYLRPGDPLVIGVDDTSTDKTGKKIPASGYFYDPKSPPFARSFKWALRFITFSALITPYGPVAAARGIILKLKLAPVVPKPRKTELPEVHKQYRRLTRNWNIATQAIEQLHLIRAQMDGIVALAKRLLVIVADATYTNETILRNLPARCLYIGRTRKDLKLFLPARPRLGVKGRTSRYGERLPTPEAIRQSDTYPWNRCNVFATGTWHDLRYKALGPVLWQNAGYQRPLMLIVIAPLHYRLTERSKILYRRPAYLLISDPNYPAHMAIQHYFHRWEIEVNHRDAKDSFGVGDAQVTNPRSVARQFNFAAFVYSLLTLASWDSYGYSRTTNYTPRPKWRNDQRCRPSALDLLSQFRQELWLYEAGGQLQEFSELPVLAQNSPKYVESATDWLAQTVPKRFPITAWSAILHANA